MAFVREIAHKVWIANIVNNAYVYNEAELPKGYVQANGYKVSRINVIATVVDTFVDGNMKFASVTVDDGSAAIRVRAFTDGISMLESLQRGDLVLVVGRVREYQEEVYVLPEIVKCVDKNWELARKIELLQTQEQYVTDPQQHVQQEVSDKKPKFKVRDIIREEGDEGCAAEVIFHKSLYSEDETKRFLDELIIEGEIYEPKPGHYRII